MKRSNRAAERGNVMFYIFIAVALLAALSYAVSESTRGNVAQLSEEQARLHATEIIEYGNIVAQAVGQLRLRGCDLDEMNMDNALVTGYTNAGAPADGSCNVFDVRGGGVEWRDVPQDWLDSAQSAQTEYGNLFIPIDTCVIDVGTNSSTLCNDSGSDEELLLIVPWIKREICLQLNTLLDITNPSGVPPTESSNAWGSGYDKFTGTLGGTEEIGDGGTAATHLTGRTAGCFAGVGTSTPPANSYHFFRVLQAR